MTSDTERRQAMVDALTGDQRRVLLAYLCGYEPEVIDAALDELGYGRQPAAQPAEASDGR